MYSSKERFTRRYKGIIRILSLLSIIGLIVASFTVHKFLFLAGIIPFIIMFKTLDLDALLDEEDDFEDEDYEDEEDELLEYEDYDESDSYWYHH